MDRAHAGAAGHLVVDWSIWCIAFHPTYRNQHRNFGAEAPIHRNFRYYGRNGAEPAVISSLGNGGGASVLLYDARGDGGGPRVLCHTLQKSF